MDTILFRDGKSPARQVRISCPMCGLRGHLNADFAPGGDLGGVPTWRCGRCGSSVMISQWFIQAKGDLGGRGCTLGGQRVDGQGAGLVTQ